MEIHNLYLTPNQKYFNLTFKIGETHDVFNITADVFQDLEKFIIHTTFSIQMDDNDQEYQRNILKVSMNVCRILNGTSGDFLSKVLGNELHRIEKIVKVPLKCPILKRTYVMTNFHISDEHFPSYLLNNLKFMTNFKVMAKVKGQKNMVFLYTMRAYGMLKKN